jgi:hypothetical protein
MPLTVEQLETELLKQPEEVRVYLAAVLLDMLDADDANRDAVEAKAHRRATERGELDGLNGDQASASLRARSRLEAAE